MDIPYILLSSKKYANLNEYQKFNSFYVYYNDNFSNQFIMINDLLFFGYIIDPFSPNKNNISIVKELEKIPYTEYDFFKVMSKYSGRFLIIKNNICFTDTCGQLQTFYYKKNNNFIICSSQKLISILEPDYTINKDKKTIIDTQREFYGYEGIIDNSFLILPNHYLDINKKSLIRYSTLSYYHSDKPNIDKIVKILEGNFKAIVSRFGKNIQMGLTGGRDTRCLLGFAGKYNNKITFFHGFSGNNKELNISKKLVKHMDLKFDEINLKKHNPSKKFINFYNSNRFIPYYAYIPVKSNLKYYMYKNNRNCMLITGTCAEIYRNFYGIKDINNYLELMHSTRTAKHKKNLYFLNFLKKYYNLSSSHCNNNISINDLFYWEQRLGFWNGSNSEEYNLFGNVFIPFNNRNLINEMLLFENNDRTTCNHYNEILKYIGRDDLLEFSYS
mgnify:CR=1 FL=1